MRQLKLPRRGAPSPGPPLPPELHWSQDGVRRSPLVLLGRREFLKALALLLAALATPLTRARQATAAARGRFFTRPESATLTALCDRILPADADPGAVALGAPVYIERLLTAFDRRGVPRIFAGGPFSHRNPFPNPRTGTPSRRRPRNAFQRFVRPTRVQELRWRAELFGTAAVSGADFNDAALGPLTGLRDLYRAGLQKVDEVATMTEGKPYAQLGTDAQDRVLALLDRDAFRPDPRRENRTFVDLLVQHTLEGCFSVPEYGGNRRGEGWKMIGLEGDSQPLGYSLYSRRDDRYHERPDHPMTSANPDELDAPRPISAEGRHIQDTIVAATRLFGE
jgi:hypothetical protein